MPLPMVSATLAKLAMFRRRIPIGQHCRVLLSVVLTPSLIAAGQPAPVEVARARLDPRFGIAESLSSPTAMAEIGAGWTRVLLAWNHIQPSAPDNWRGFGRVLHEPVLDAEVARGLRVAAVLQYTPPWAASDVAHGTRAVPLNLYLPYDDPQNYFGNFVYETVSRYRGRIEDWIIWNEPDIGNEAADGGASHTWAGTAEDFAQLLKVGYLAAKRANPNAVVSFPATSYNADTLSVRPHYYERVLDALSRDPSAAAHNFYHDAVSVNIYYRSEDVYQVHAFFKSIQQHYGVDRAVWLTETNAMPGDDRSAPCWERHTGQPWEPSLNQQAAFAVQSFAMAAAAGYERIAWWRLIDGNTCVQTGMWGLIRDNRSWRPAAEALRTAISHFSGFLRAHYVPLTVESGSSAYLVAFDRPGGQRVSVVWSGDSRPVTVQVPRSGAQAYAIDVLGQPYPVDSNASAWLLRLPEASASFMDDPPGYHYIGGSPILLVEGS